MEFKHHKYSGRKVMKQMISNFTFKLTENVTRVHLQCMYAAADTCCLFATVTRQSSGH